MAAGRRYRRNGEDRVAPVLTKYGIPFLIWLDEVVLPETRGVIEQFQEYVWNWRELLEV